MFWRGGTAGDGSCYDVADSSVDQVYAPETRSPAPSEVAAVDATWGIRLLKSGALFATHYDGGRDVACGADADGRHLYQNSARRCAEGGMLAVAILQTYYSPDLTIVGEVAPIGAGVGVELTISAQPAGATAGAPLPVQPAVTVVDVSGNTVTSGPMSVVAVTLALAAGPPGASLRCTGGLSRAAVKGVATFDGCIVDVAGSGYVLAASATALAGAATAPFDVAPAVPALSMAGMPPSIAWGASMRLVARLAPPPAAGGTVDGRTVQLERSMDAQTWTAVARAVTDASGNAELTDRPANNSYYRLVFDGASDLGPATGAVQRVLVRQLMVLRPDNGRAVRVVARGTKVAFTALVRPAREGVAPGRVLCRVYLMVGRTWTLKRESVVTADAGGRAVLRVTFPAAGHWAVRAIAIPTPLNANSVWSPMQRYDAR
jgi:hypothetical protein